jgi:hypothetical protein
LVKANNRFAKVDCILRQLKKPHPPQEMVALHRSFGHKEDDIGRFHKVGRIRVLVANKPTVQRPPLRGRIQKIASKESTEESPHASIRRRHLAKRNLINSNFPARRFPNIGLKPKTRSLAPPVLAIAGPVKDDYTG